jgi:hypothetical protein
VRWRMAHVPAAESLILLRFSHSSRSSIDTLIWISRCALLKETALFEASGPSP